METGSTIKVAIIGAESTGKTSLAEALAAHYHCQMVPEYARVYLERLEGAYTQHDVEAIAHGQIKTENQLAQDADGLLICDTNLLVIKIWMDHSYGAAPDWILKEIARRTYPLHILTDYDIPYQPDPLREHPEMRDYFTGKYHEELVNLNLPFIMVSGTPDQRLAKAVAAIDGLMG